MTRSDIVAALIPYGSSDIATANEIIDAAGLNDSDVATYIQEFCSDCGMDMAKIDVVACVYEFILNNVRTLIEEKTQIDILNDEKYTISVAGNYLATSYDSSSENGQHVEKLIRDNFDLTKNEIESDFEGVSQLKWFVDQIDF